MPKKNLIVAVSAAAAVSIGGTALATGAFASPEKTAPVPAGLPQAPAAGTPAPTILRQNAQQLRSTISDVTTTKTDAGAITIATLTPITAGDGAPRICIALEEAGGSSSTGCRKIGDTEYGSKPLAIVGAKLGGGYSAAAWFPESAPAAKLTAADGSTVRTLGDTAVTHGSVAGTLIAPGVTSLSYKGADGSSQKLDLAGLVKSVSSTTDAP